MEVINLLVFLLSVLFVQPVPAKGTARAEIEPLQEREYKFRTLSPPGGLFYDGVDEIVKDGNGFIWVLLNSDLLRFDGYEYKRYYSYFQNSGTVSWLLFHDIAVDSQGRLYVSCAQGLFRYDHSSDSFEKLLDKSYMMFLDNRDNVWMWNGDFRILRGVDSLEVQTYDGRTIDSRVRTTETIADGSFLIGTNNGQILCYDYSSETFSLFYSFPGGTNIVKMQRFGDKLWVLQNNRGLALIDIPTQSLETTYDLSQEYDGQKMFCRDFRVDKYGHIWIATRKGICFFNPLTMEYSLYLHSDADIFSIPHNSVWTVTDDPEGNILIGTFCGGVCMVDPDENKSFTSYTAQHSDLSHNTVSAFAEDEHALWIGSEGGGVNRLDKSTGKISHVNPGAGYSLSSRHIKSLVRDNSGRLWIATYLGGMMSYDIRSGAIRYFNDKGPVHERLLLNDLRKIVPQGVEGLWIAYQSPRLAVSFLPYGGGSIEHIHLDTVGIQRFIFDMHRGGDYLWIITQHQLYRLDVRDRSVADVSSDKIPFLNAMSLCADAEDNVWIGTSDGKVLRHEAGTGEFTTISGLAAYNASAVYSLTFDVEGNLWMGTDNGLFRYVPKTGKFSRFDESDGAQGRMYYPHASMTTASGKLLFGGTNGFSIVDSRAITESHRQPNAIISEFIADNIVAKPQFGNAAPQTYYGQEIVISHRHTSFGFRLASDNYAIPSKTRYRYRLAEYDPSPVTVDADSRTVVYSNIRAGTYNFEVSASIDGELWGEPVSVKIVRKPAPWNSRAAWIAYCTVLLAIAGTILYYYIERRRLAMQLYLDGLDKQKKEELHQSQLRFFTNISHDFRTPLSLILGAVDNLGSRGCDDRYYRIISSNSQRLLDLVNELMDFRTAENGMMKLQVQPIAVNRLIKDISTDFYDFARNKEIDFRVECDKGLSMPVQLDRAVVEKITMNLLNNAFKYTPRGGMITISTHAPDNVFRSRFDTSYHIPGDMEAAGHFFTIAVSDTGVGISKESISKVFDRYYKVNTTQSKSHLGTGIGLALVKSLVSLHKGAITIFSERDKGTDMLVELPFDGSAYAQDEFLAECDCPDEAPADEKFGIDKSAAESMLMRTQKMILIVEDNDDLRMLIADFLSSNYGIAQAADGIAASEWLAENEADLIISDIMMPGKDGITLCREVKENVDTSHIPFILLTAKTDAASKFEGTGSGADLYFEKPVDLNLLMLTVDNVFSRQNALREYYSKNYFVDSSELSQNGHDNAFLKRLIDTIERNLTEPIIDVNFIASELSMSRRKLYSKIKTLTDKSIVEFILNYRMRKAARLLLEEDMSIQQVMEKVGIKSQSYFTRVFKEEFDQTPSAFAKSHGRHPSRS